MTPYTYTTTSFYGYQQCRCTWTVCCCMPRWHAQTYVTIDAGPKTKREANKKRMESIPRRGTMTQRVRISKPNVRPSIQALSMRIR